MRHSLFSVVLLSSIAAWHPQQPAPKPDFSGTWKLDPAASTVAAPPGTTDGPGPRVSAALLEPIVITQNTETLSITQTPGDAPFTFTYRLDGSTSKLPWPSGPGQTVEATAVAKWDGDRLRIATQIPTRAVVYNNSET